MFSTFNNDRDLLQKTKDLIDVLDETGMRTGEVLSREEIHRLGKLHRAVHFYLFDMKGNILLQRRPDNVDHYPNKFSISLTGHINNGEFSYQALKREIKEELGICPDTDNLNINFMFSFRQDARLRTDYIDRQFHDVYFCQHDFQLRDIKYNPGEVSEIKLVPFAHFQKMVKAKSSELVPVYERSAKELVNFLDNIMHNQADDML